MEPTSEARKLAIEAQGLLFSEGGTLSFKRLGQALQCDDAKLHKALAELSRMIEGSGLSLILSDTHAGLVVSHDAQDTVQKAAQRELGRDIGDAGLEVLAIVLYRGPSTRAHIDYTRGVNSSSTIRNLLGRGLVERAENPTDAREYLYRPTVELLAHLGMMSGRELPEYDTIARELTAFTETAHEDGPFSQTTRESDASEV